MGRNHSFDRRILRASIVVLLVNKQWCVHLNQSTLRCFVSEWKTIPVLCECMIMHRTPYTRELRCLGL